MSTIDTSIPDESPGPPKGKHLVLNGLDWEEYRRISDALTEMKVRLTYDRGRLEIMGSSLIHERWTGLLAMFVWILAEETKKTLCSAGSTTLDREDLDRGIEPDSCFYIENEPRIRAPIGISTYTKTRPQIWRLKPRSVTERLGSCPFAKRSEYQKFGARTAKASRFMSFNRMPIIRSLSTVEVSRSFDRPTLYRIYRNGAR